MDDQKRKSNLFKVKLKVETKVKTKVKPSS